MLYLAEKLKYLTIKSRNLLIEKAIEISKIINGLIKSIALKH